MEKQFVPYEIAIKVNEKKFTGSCFGDYFIFKNGSNILNWDDDREDIITQNPDDNITKLPAPLWQQVIDWLRKTHRLMILVLPQHQSICDDEPLYFLAIEKFISNSSFEEIYNSSDKLHYTTYEEARQAAIEHALTLI